MQLSILVFLFTLMNIMICSLCFAFPVTTDYLENDDEPHETQHAICKVFTKEIEATAKATITRQLKGVCSSKDLHLQFQNIFRELQEIKQALGLSAKTYRYKTLDDVNLINITNVSNKIFTTSTPSTNHDLYDDIDFNISNEYNITEPNEASTQIMLVKKDKLEDEIATFNDTVVESIEGDLYFYYWRIPEISNLLKRRNIYISSAGFSVLGHTLYLQFYPSYMDNNYIGILLKTETNSFLKKHKILILGQASTENEISSTILYGLKKDEKIFNIEQKMISSEFIRNNSLLVKLKIYLNS